jgi:hypothetical protein
VVWIQAGFTLLSTRHGGIPHRPAEPKLQAKASAGTDGARSPVGSGLNQLAQDGSKPEPQLDHVQDKGSVVL